MEVLDVTPNELLSGEWKYVNQSEKEVCQFLRAEERLNAELKHGHYDNFFDSEEEWLEYELEKLREYITDYINGTNIEASDLYLIKEFIQHLKFQKLLDRYDDLYSMDMFGESIEGHKYKTPYQVVKMINPNSKEDMELLREVLRNNHFDDEDDGFNGMSLMFPLLIMGVFIFALFMSGFFAAWVYQDCRKRNDDGILWAIITFFTTPFIGLLVYFLRRSEVKQSCVACGHLVSLKAKYCEECGSKIEHKEEINDMEMKRTHHIGYIIMGTVSMILMITCLTGFIVSAASGKGINSDITSNDKVWNIGGISMNYEVVKDGVWTLDFKSASDGFIAQEDMIINNAETDILYADISCGTVPSNASITLYLVQGDIVKSVDVTNLSETLEYSLDEFENGKIHVRLLIEGVEDTISKIYIK